MLRRGEHLRGGGDFSNDSLRVEGNILGGAGRV